MLRRAFRVHVTRRQARGDEDRSLLAVAEDAETKARFTASEQRMNLVFRCWSEGIAWYRCLGCGAEWVSDRERWIHRHESKGDGK